MAVKYKQRCYRCKKNYVIASWKQKYVLCYDCQKDELKEDIKNKKMKELFDIPEEFYKESLFLRDIKLSYLKFGKLSDKQIEAFKKTIEEIKEKPKINSLR